MAAGGIDLGTAWLNVVPSFRGMTKAISAEMDGAEKILTSRTSGALSKAGLGAAKGIGNALSKIGKVGLGAITAGVAGVGASFASLLPEVVAASDATDKFKSTLNFAGLGSEQIDKLTKSTKAYADKTVYDLADIQNVTAQLAANSVPNFDKVAEAAGNLNAVAGGNKETFRSVGMVLTQTAGAGKLTTENWNQLADAIPGASGRLQEAMKANGAYTGDFRDAMAKGQITAEEFNQAIMDLGMEDAAVQAASSTATFEGAWGNLQNSMVTGMTAIVDKFKPAATKIMGAVADQLGPAFDAAAEKVGPLADKVNAFAQAMADGSITIEDVAKRVATAAGGFATLWGAGSAMGNIDTIMGFLEPLDGIPGAITAAKDKASGAIKAFPSFMDGLGEDLKIRASYAGDAFGGLGNTIADKLTSAKGVVSSKVSGLADTVAAPFRSVGDKIGGALSGVGEKISGPLDKITGPISGMAGKVKTGLAPLGTAFSGIGEKIGGPLQSGLGQVGGMITSFFSPGNFMKFFAVGAIAAALVAGLGAVVSSGGTELLDQINTFAAQLPGKISEFVGQLTAQLPQFMTMGVQVITTILDSLIQAAPTLINGAGEIITTLVSGLAAALPQLIPMAVTLLTTLVTSLLAQLPLILQAGLDLLLGLVQGIIAALPQLISAIPQIITTLASALVTSLPMIIDTGIQLLTALIDGIVTTIPLLIDMLPTIIDSVVTTLVGNLPLIIQAGIQLLVSLITGLANALPQLVSMVPTIVLTIVSTLAQNFPQIIQGGISAIGALVRGLVQAIPQVASTMAQLPGKMLSALGDVGSLLLSAGRSIIDGLISGITGAFGRVKSKLGELTSLLPDWKGPAPVDRVILRPAGQMVIDGFRQGLESQYDSVRRSLSGFTNDLSGDVALNTTIRRTMPPADLTTDPGLLAAALSGMPISLVLDDGERLDAHIETVTTGVLGARRTVAGRSR